MAIILPRARAQALIPPEISPNIEYAIFEFKTDADLPNEMRILINGDKTHLFWPLPDGAFRSIPVLLR